MLEVIHPPSKIKMKKKSGKKILIFSKMSVELNEGGVICTHEERRKTQQVC